MSNVLSQPLAFVDIETTGGSHFTSRVLEVGVVRVEAGRVVRKYQTLLQPGESVPESITALTGIADEDVDGAPRFDQVAADLAEIMDGAIFIAHNVRFDYGFLKMEFGRLGVPFRPQLLCTVRLSRRLFPGFKSHKLQSLIERHGLSAPARHRAYDDAHCLWQFFQLCLAEFDLDEVEAALKAQLGTQSLPAQMDRAEVEALPEGPGVYIFEDGDGAPLYVGKSVNVQRRVMSHFAADHERGAEFKLAQTVRHLRGIATHGELSALLLESDLVKELQPLYNRKLRQKERMVIVVADRSADGYSTPRLGDTDEISPADGVRLLTVYTTMGRARLSLHALAARYRLCPKLMGLERTKRACFASQLGKCDGACEGREAPESYNERFDSAFERQRVATWPYPGPVLIREGNPQMEGAAGFVVENWCLLARLSELEDGTVETTAEAHRFDMDRYKIIKQYLEQRRGTLRVSPLGPSELSRLLEPAIA